MFNFTINPSSPDELAAYLAIIKASGIHCQATVSTGKPGLSSPDLAERYKAATGKGKARVTGEELKAAGWDGEGEATQDMKDKAMRLVIGETDKQEEQGAVYEAEGETEEPSADLDY